MLEKGKKSRSSVFFLRRGADCDIELHHQIFCCCQSRRIENMISLVRPLPVRSENEEFTNEFVREIPKHKP